MDALCRIHRANMAEIGGLAKHPSFFQAVARHFRAGAEYDVYVGRLDGEVVAALLVFWFGDVAEYFTPATDHDHRSAQPLAAILDRALADAVEHGCTWWNWGGTRLKQEGVLRFKRKWGAREQRYRYFVKLNDGSLLDESATSLSDAFAHFYVVPFDSLRAEGHSLSQDRRLADEQDQRHRGRPRARHRRRWAELALDQRRRGLCRRPHRAVRRA
jgi:hypothetical protein